MATTTKFVRTLYREYERIAAYYETTGHHIVHRGDDVVSYFDLRRPLEDRTILTDPQRQALWLNVVQDLPQAAVAVAMDTTKARVAEHVNAALERAAAFYDAST